LKLGDVGRRRGGYLLLETVALGYQRLRAGATWTLGTEGYSPVITKTTQTEQERMFRWTDAEGMEDER
jgi:hypothetical protein